MHPASAGGSDDSGLSSFLQYTSPPQQQQLDTDDWQCRQNRRSNSAAASWEADTNLFFKTKMCAYIRQGRACFRALNCRFAHSEDELRTPIKSLGALGPQTSRLHSCFDDALPSDGHNPHHQIEPSFRLVEHRIAPSGYSGDNSNFFANSFSRQSPITNITQFSALGKLRKAMHMAGNQDGAVWGAPGSFGYNQAAPTTNGFIMQQQQCLVNSSTVGSCGIAAGAALCDPQLAVELLRKQSNLPQDNRAQGRTVPVHMQPHKKMRRGKRGGRNKNNRNAAVAAARQQQQSINTPMLGCLEDALVGGVGSNRCLGGGTHLCSTGPDACQPLSNTLLDFHQLSGNGKPLRQFAAPPRTHPSIHLHSSIFSLPAAVSAAQVQQQQQLMQQHQNTTVSARHGNIGSGGYSLPSYFVNPHTSNIGGTSPPHGNSLLVHDDRDATSTSAVAASLDDFIGSHNGRGNGANNRILGQAGVDGLELLSRDSVQSLAQRLTECLNFRSSKSASSSTTPGSLALPPNWTRRGIARNREGVGVVGDYEVSGSIPSCQSPSDIPLNIIQQMYQQASSVCSEGCDDAKDDTAGCDPSYDSGSCNEDSQGHCSVV